MSDVTNYLLTVDRDQVEAIQIVHDTAKKLEYKDTTLIDVVQSLGEYINDEDAVIRSKASGFLSQVVGSLPPAFLTRQQLQVLCEFFCERIEDGGSVGGLERLQSLARFNKEMATMTFRAMMEHLQDLQIRPQSERFLVLSLLNGLMSNHRDALKDLGAESLVGIVDLVSGEKDPRNLMIVFSVLKVIMVEWDIVGHSEALFDSVFCYFPIAFRPPPDDPYGITAQDLKVRLRECISASGSFAPYAFPQLLDKLDTTSPNVKKDVLQTVTACVSSYDANTLSNYSITVWDSLKFEILNGEEEDLTDEALVVLHRIATCLSAGTNTTDPKTPLTRYITSISKECNEKLHEPTHKQAKPAGRILSSLASASRASFHLIVKAVVPPTLTLYQASESISHQRALLEVFSDLLQSAKVICGSSALSNLWLDVQNPLGFFKDQLFEMFSQALMSTAEEEVSFRIVALDCLLGLCMMWGYLQDNEIGMVVQWFDQITLSQVNSGRGELRDAAIMGLVDISKIKPNLITDITFPDFMARLPDSDTNGSSDYTVTLHSLARLSIEKATSGTLIRRLISKFDVVLQHGDSVAYQRTILATLQHLLGARDLASDPHLVYYHEEIVVGLVKKTALAATGHNGHISLLDYSMQEALGRVSNLILRSLDAQKQAVVAAQIYTLFCEEGEFDPIPFRRDANIRQRSTMILSSYLLAAIKREIELPYSERGAQTLLEELVTLSSIEVEPAIRQGILRQLGLLTNKFMIQDDLPSVVLIFSRLLESLARSQDNSSSLIRPAIWLAKALILRLYQTEVVLQHLLHVLPDLQHGAAAARGFGIILASDELLSRENGAAIRLLARQKVFAICVPEIASKFGASEPAVKTNYLVALSAILQHTRTDILLSEIDPILPLLLQSLDLPVQEVKAATIDTLTIVSQESPRHVEGHISSLINRLLKSAVSRTMNNPKVRYKSLRCLKAFPGKVRDSTLLPFKGAIVREMTSVLDDPKRHVRKEAVDCRAVWINMDEPISDD